MLSNFINPSHPESTQQPPAAAQTDDGGKRHAQKACFAAFNALKPRFEADSISESAFWCWGLWFSEKAPFESRKQLSALNWTTLHARLQAAQNDPACFKSLCAEIRHAGDCQAVRVDTEKTIYSGLVDKKILDRVQKYANDNSCVVKLIAYGRDQTFQPKSEVAPITSCRFDGTEDEPLMYIKFAGNDKEYKYQHLNLRQNTECLLMWSKGQKQELKDYLDRIRIAYDAYCQGDLSKEELENT